MFLTSSIFGALCAGLVYCAWELFGSAEARSMVWQGLTMVWPFFVLVMSFASAFYILLRVALVRPASKEAEK